MTEKERKQPYIPGTLGLSDVSTQIQADYGEILPRRDRRQQARENGVKFQPYYSGKGPGRQRGRVN